MIRVCNLCLEKLANVDDDNDNDDDRRSVISVSHSLTSPFPAHQMGIGIDSGMNLAHHHQSPFAASQLFGRTDEPFNLYSIAETKRPYLSGSDESGWASRPLTPGDFSFMNQHNQQQPQADDNASWEPIRANPAPFRRGVTDDEKDASTAALPNAFVVTNENSPAAPGSGSKTPIEFPLSVTVPVSIDTEAGASSIQFPVSSPEHQYHSGGQYYHGGLDSPRPGSTMRSRFNSYGGDFDVPTPFIRSRVHSRLDSFPAGEPAWRTRRESTA